MNNTNDIANLFVKRRTTGIPGDRLPEADRPATLDQALALQTAVTACWCEQQNDSIGAWKCGLPSDGKLIIGPIYTSTINTVPPVSLWPQNGVAAVEPELAFFFGKDLPPRREPYSEAEIDQAIIRTHMALELIYNRYSDPASCSFYEKLADGLVNQGLYIGPQVPDDLAAEATELDIELLVNNSSSHFDGKHPNGKPRAALYWLVNYLREQNIGIQAGQAVITGSYAGVLNVPLDTHITFVYLGTEMAVKFTAK